MWAGLKGRLVEGMIKGRSVKGIFRLLFHFVIRSTIPEDRESLMRGYRTFKLVATGTII